MTISYEEALNRCLKAVRQGRDLADVIAALPERYTERLRQDATLAAQVGRYAATVPAPGVDARRLASTRMLSELNAARLARNAPAPSGGWAGFGLPRFTIAGFVLAAVLVGVSFLLTTSNGGDGIVEAATVEGVVVANGAGSLTVQTLSSLEEVTIPGDAELSDETGASLDLASIEVGQVVLIRGQRPPGGHVLAANVQRLLNGLPGWCTDAPARCRQIGVNLQQAQERCRANPQTCPMLQERVEPLIRQVGDIAALEELKQRCRESGEGNCQEFTALCRRHPDLCIAPNPPEPVIDRVDEARDRLQALQRLCDQRDTKACRQIAQICASHPVLCPEPPRPPITRPNAPIDRPAVEPTTSSRPQPTATTAAQRVAPTPSPVTDQRPTR